MKLEVRWDRRAANDLIRLHNFLAIENSAVAVHAISKIYEAVQLISEYPAIGKKPETVNEVREWTVDFGRGAFVIRYQLTTNQYLAVTRVWHSRE